MSQQDSPFPNHVFKKGKFITSFNNLPCNLELYSWIHGEVPEYLWLGMIFNNYSRERGLEKLWYIISQLKEITPEIKQARFSEILTLPKDKQALFFTKLQAVTSIECLAPLTVLFSYFEYACFNDFVFQDTLSVEEKALKINEVIHKMGDGQSEFSTDIKFILLSYLKMQYDIKMPKEIALKIAHYPKYSHEEEVMREIRPLIRSNFGVFSKMINENNNNETFINKFWANIEQLVDCSGFVIEHKKVDLEMKKIYMERTQQILDYYSKQLNATNKTDKKMIVLLGMTVYAYKQLNELYVNNLENAISGRLICRGLIEIVIMMKFLLKKESTSPNIWTAYQAYGIGQYKLINEREKERKKLAKEDEYSQIMHNYIDLLVGEYARPEFIDMDTKYFDNANIRNKAEAVDEKSLYNIYDYGSTFSHAMWGAIRESSMLACDKAAHIFHSIPDTTNEQKLSSVWDDSVIMMNKILQVMADTYGIPDNLRME